MEGGDPSSSWTRFSNENVGFRVMGKVREYPGEPMRQRPQVPAQLVRDQNRRNSSSSQPYRGPDPHWAVLAGGALAAAVTAISRKKQRPTVNNASRDTHTTTSDGLASFNKESASSNANGHVSVQLVTGEVMNCDERFSTPGGSPVSLISLKSLNASALTSPSLVPAPATLSEPSNAREITASPTSFHSPVHSAAPEQQLQQQPQTLNTTNVHGEQAIGDSRPNPSSVSIENHSATRAAVQKLRSQLRSREEIIFGLQRELSEEKKKSGKAELRCRELEGALRSAHKLRLDFEEENVRLRSRANKGTRAQNQVHSLGQIQGQTHGQEQDHGQGEEQMQETSQRQVQTGKQGPNLSEWESRVDKLERRLEEALHTIEEQGRLLEIASERDRNSPLGSTGQRESPAFGNSQWMWEKNMSQNLDGLGGSQRRTPSPLSKAKARAKSRLSPGAADGSPASSHGHSPNRGAAGVHELSPLSAKKRSSQEAGTVSLTGPSQSLANPLTWSWMANSHQGSTYGMGQQQERFSNSGSPVSASADFASPAGFSVYSNPIARKPGSTSASPAEDSGKKPASSPSLPVSRSLFSAAAQEDLVSSMGQLSIGVQASSGVTDSILTHEDTAPAPAADMEEGNEGKQAEAIPAAATSHSLVVFAAQPARSAPAQGVTSSEASGSLLIADPNAMLPEAASKFGFRANGTPKDSFSRGSSSRSAHGGSKDGKLSSNVWK